MDYSLAAAEIFNKHAVPYQNKFMDVSLYADTFDFFCANIEKHNASVLELACGPGNITKYLLTKRPDLKIYGIDLAPNMIDLARANNPTATFDVMDCRLISNLNNKFDAIMCGFCLPYLSKEETTTLFNDAAALLNTNGIIYLSTMEDEYANSKFVKGSTGDEIFMHYYTETDLTTMLQQATFKVLHISRVKSIMTNGLAVIDLIIIAEKLL